MINSTEIATYLFDCVYPVFTYGAEQMHLFVLSFVYLIEELELSLIT